jgi:hypothetical protein
MTGGAAPLPGSDQRALEEAVSLLQQPRFAMRLANMAGKPFEGAIKMMPRANGLLQRAVERAMLECLTIAIESRDGEIFAPSAWRAKTLTGLSGAISGLFGGLLLPLEMPLTITLMLRAISDIASHEGEDLNRLEARFACLEVFALSDGKGGERKGAAGAIGYYQVRATLAKLTGAVVAAMLERGALDASAPVVTRLLAEVVGRFGIVAGERAAASSVPILGAIGGATLNVMFTDHFERMARGHFAIRRLERAYGPERVQSLYRLALM